MSRIQVTVPEELKDVVPGYLERAAGNLDTLRSAIADNNFDEVRRIGHNYKGSGGGYGFDEISRIGADIEEAGKAADGERAVSLVDEFKDYLAQVEVI